MSLPKVTGIETEYGILIRGAAESDPFLASQLLLQQCEEAGELLRTQDRYREIGLETAEVSTQTKTSGQWTGFPYSLMLPNGSRFYIDHAHPEYCTPEAIFPRDVVAADKAGEIVVERCRQRANASGMLPEGEEIAIYKNNSDRKGNSYGCHENYLLTVSTYENLLQHQRYLTLSTLVPFLVTRNLLCGAGKVGSENGTPPVAFQLGQRADFFETLFGLQTTHHRPLINTRDESHAQRTDFRRLHVIVGDANLAEYSTYLKVGTTQLILMMLEDDFLSLDLTLQDPLAAVKTVSRDLTFQAPLLLAKGERVSGLEIQRQYLHLAKMYLDDRDGTDALREVVQLWEDTLDKLSQNWQQLSQRLDWAIKRNLLERYLRGQGSDWQSMQQWESLILKTLSLKQQVVGEDSADLLAMLRLHCPDSAQLEDDVQHKGLDWSDYWRQRQIYFTLRRLDLEYHDIRQGSDIKDIGLFYRLQQRGAVERLLNAKEIERFVDQPPEDTRAYLRGHCIARYASLIQQVDWSEMTFYVPETRQRYYVSLPDLLSGTKAQVGALLETSPDLSTLLQALEDV